MKKHTVIKEYKTQYHNPIVLQVNDVVTLGEAEKEEKWKGWIWAENERNGGWVPVQILEISEDGKTGKVLEFYSAKELDVQEGDTVEKLKSLNGWSWVRETASRDEGWVPDEILD